MRRFLLDARRRAQTVAIRAVRASPVFPEALVDRLGEDDRLHDSRTDARVMLYFPGALDTLYQVSPWLPTLEAVHAAHGAVVICQDSRVAARLRAATAVPVLTIARYGTLDGLLSRSDVKLALYVSHVPRNFEALRFSSLLHAYIGHGDSDKGVSASNQLKAYDYVFAPGQAAVDRIARRLMRFDAAANCRIVGQPLTLSVPPAERHAPVGDRRTVLYAPTWEGAQPSVAYSSVLSHGEALVAALLADRRFRVLYRPHPLIGVTSRLYAGADQRVRALVGTADADAGHRVVEPAAESLETSFARSDALVTDVSAVATAWLPSLRPLVVTESATPGSQAADSGMLTVVPRLTASGAGRAADLLWYELTEDPGRAARADLMLHYLSPYWPDGVVGRFVAVCADVMAERDRLRAELLASGATGV